MNDAYLHIYLNDHLAMMKGEAALARRSGASNRRTAVGDFLHRLQNELRAQCSIVTDLLHRTSGSEDRIKQSAIWVAEKLGRFKLNGSLVNYSNLSRVVELETLGAAAQARVAMWDSLDFIGNSDKRMDGITFKYFRDQTANHILELDQQRSTDVSLAIPKSAPFRCIKDVLRPRE